MDLQALLQRGVQHSPVAPQWWKGVVMIIRADPTKMEHLKQPMAIVVSPMRLEYNWRRAIHLRVDYRTVKGMFKVDDGDAVEVYAELRGDHLQYFERADKAAFFLTPEKGNLVEAAWRHSPNLSPSPIVH